MKKFNIVLLALASLLMVACASHTVPYSTNTENTWFLHKSSFGNTYPIYCKANPTNTGARPVCYEADIK